MTIREATLAGYSLSRIGRAWLLSYQGSPLVATFRPPYTLLATVEIHAMVRTTLRHGMRRL